MQSAQQSPMAYFVPIMSFTAPAGSGAPATPPAPAGSGVPVPGLYPNDPYGSGVPNNPPGSGVPVQGYDPTYGSGVPPNPPGSCTGAGLQFYVCFRWVSESCWFWCTSAGRRP